MKKIIKLDEKVFVVNYNVSTRRAKCYVHSSEFPMSVDVFVFYAEEPLDMFFQSDKDLLSDIKYYMSLSTIRTHRLNRPVFFGKNGRKLSSYWQL